MYDCPVKTEKDMAFSLDSGVDMNVDNFQELHRLDAMLQSRGYDGSAVEASKLPTLGVRLNPQVLTVCTSAQTGPHSPLHAHVLTAVRLCWPDWSRRHCVARDGHHDVQVRHRHAGPPRGSHPSVR